MDALRRNGLLARARAGQPDRVAIFSQLVRGLGAPLICPGGDVRVMINGIRELAKTFAPEPPAPANTPAPAKP